MGYINYSMSERAQTAYESGERPKSKWTKSDLLKAIKDCLLDESLNCYFQKLTTSDLKWFLRRSSWHHTSCQYNRTDFYKIDDSLVNDQTAESLNALLIDSKQKKQDKKSKEKPLNTFITALVTYTLWTGTRKHPKAEQVQEVVFYRKNDKLVRTNNGNKRISSLYIIKKIEQKTKFATSEKLNNKKEIKK